MRRWDAPALLRPFPGGNHGDANVLGERFDAVPKSDDLTMRAGHIVTMGQTVPNVKDSVSRDERSLNVAYWGPMTRPTKPSDKAVLFKRLADARDAAGLTQQQAADFLGINRDRYSKYEGRSVIPVDFAVRIAERLGKPFEYFVRVDPVNEIFPTSPHTDISPFAGTRPVMAVGAVQAGMFREALEWEPDRQERLAIPVDIPYSDKPLKALKVVGPSMNMWYPDGSYVVLVPTIHLPGGWLPATGQHVIAQRRNEWGEFEATIKEIAYDGNDILLWPRSDHPDFQKPWRETAPKLLGNDDDEPLRITGLVVYSMKAAPGV